MKLSESYPVARMTPIPIELVGDEESARCATLDTTVVMVVVGDLRKLCSFHAGIRRGNHYRCSRNECHRGEMEPAADAVVAALVRRVSFMQSVARRVRRGTAAAGRPCVFCLFHIYSNGPVNRSVTISIEAPQYR